MGLFDKKFCSVCGQKIGLLGNRKLEDGNLCKNCASQLSPWFSERRHSTVDDIKAQLAYREQNRAAVRAFHTTKSIGKYEKLLVDENAGKFMVTSASDLEKANPDVIDLSAVTGCDLELDENRNELKQRDANGNMVSYRPPRFEYTYNFYVTIRVNHPYFDEIRYRLNTGAVNTGARCMSGVSTNWNLTTRSSLQSNMALNEYTSYMQMGNEIKQILTQPRTQAAYSAPQQAFTPAPAPTPAGPVSCPTCGATTTPDANGCCEYCGCKIH